MATTRDYAVEKATTLQYNDIETASQDGKAAKHVDGGDYSGAVAKTDPAEIALVKKLDSRIMPALFCMYFLYVDAHFPWSGCKTCRRREAAGSSVVRIAYSKVS
jgi:hypothetical protein